MKAYKYVTVRIEQDSDCESPMEYNEGVHITYADRSRYTLGNETATQEEHEELARRIKAGEILGLPVFAYVHSGVMLSTAPFSCPWDSGQSGFIWVEKATALDWYGGKILTAAKRAKALESLKSIITEFPSWLSGDCYGYIIEDVDGEHLDSCWGFIGHEYAEEEAQTAADYWEKTIPEDQARDATERQHWEARDVVTC